MPHVSHSIRTGSVGIKSGSVGITDGNIRVTSGSIDASIMGSVLVYGDVEVGTIPVTGNFYPGTQDVSVVGSVPVYGDVEVGTVPVIGAFYPGSQRVYGDIEVGTVPVTGDFYPATQSISGSVGISSGSIGIKEPIDSLTGGIPTITTIHRKVHEGEMYHVTHLFIAVPNNGTADFLIDVGTTKNLHAVIGAVSTGDVHYRFYEGPTIASNGTVANIFNMDRTSVNTPSPDAYYSPTVTSVGTLMSHMVLPGGTKKEATGGEIRRDTEWIFVKTQKYLCRLINKGGDAKDMCLHTEFYEIT